MKQTAVEWLFEHLTEYGFDLSHHKIEIQQAKEMEKEQIMEFTNDYVLTQCSASFEGNVTVEMSTEEYYKLTFK